MNREKIIGFAFGPIVSALMGLITVPLIAWNFNAEDIGRMSVFQVAMSFFLLFSVLGLDQAYVREYHEVKDKQQLFLMCFLPGLCLFVAICIPSIYFANNVSLFMYEIDNPVLIWITLLVFLISYVTRFLSLILRMEERGWAYSISQVFPKIIQLLMLCLLATLTFTKEFIHLQLITLISMLGVVVFYGWYTKNEWIGAFSKKIDKNQIHNLLKFGAPLVISGLSFWGLTAVSTLALKGMSTLEELAVYSIANSFAAVGVIFQSVFTVVWAPTVYKWLSQGIDMSIVDKIARQALAVVCLIIAITGGFSWILDYFLPSEYGGVKSILLCMLIQPLFYTMSEITCVGIAIRRRTSYMIGIVFAAMLTNWILCYFLIPISGASGAAVANAIAFTVFFTLRTEVSARIWRCFARKELYCFATVTVVLVIANTFISEISISVLSTAWGLFFIFTLYYFKDSLREIKNSIAY